VSSQSNLRQRDPGLGAHVLVDERRPRREIDRCGSTEEFDRIGFAMRLLAILRPPRMRIAVYERYQELTVERGRNLESGPTWAMVGIPPHASREHIALALAELAGIARVPFVVDLLAAVGAHAD
jgi:hypothetical protein